MPVIPNSTVSNTQQAQTSQPMDIAQLASELKSLKTQLTQQAQTIAAQNAVLTSQRFLQPQDAKAEPEATPTKFENPQQFLEYMFKEMDTRITSSQDNMLEQLRPIIRKATPDAKVWTTTDEANKIIQKNPGMSMETALEFAELRQQQAEVQAAATATEAEGQRTKELADLASVGQQANSVGHLQQTANSDKTFNAEMEEQWQRLDMDDKSAAFERESDVWGAPAAPGVQMTFTEPAGADIG